MIRRRALALGVLLAVAAAAPIGGEEVPPPPAPVPDSAFRAVEVPPSIVDPAPPTVAPTRPPAPQPAPPLIVVAVAPPSSSLVGRASWYCLRGRSSCYREHRDTRRYDAYAAAGPALRAAICGDQACTSWRGRVVRVNGRSVKLVDWCFCYRGQANEKLIDLYHDVYFGDSRHAGVGGEVRITW